MGYFLAALLSGFMLFNGVATPGRAAHMAEKALQKQYPTAKVDVHIEGKKGRSVMRGNFKLVHIDLADLALADLPFAEPSPNPKISSAGKLEVELKNLTWGTLPVERARFDFDDVKYDFNALKQRSQFDILGMTGGQMQLRFSTKELRPAFAGRLTDIENVDIALEGDQFTLTGQKDVVGTKSPVVLKARLVGEKNALRLDEPKLSLSGAPLPDLAAQKAMVGVNPIYEFDKDGKWPFDVNIVSAVGKGDFLDITANLTLKAKYMVASPQ